jgi:hypothetical protein
MASTSENDGGCGRLVNSLIRVGRECESGGDGRIRSERRRSELMNGTWMIIWIVKKISQIMKEEWIMHE